MLRCLLIFSSCLLIMNRNIKTLCNQNNKKKYININCTKSNHYQFLRGFFWAGVVFLFFLFLRLFDNLARPPTSIQVAWFTNEPVFLRVWNFSQVLPSVHQYLQQPQSLWVIWYNWITRFKPFLTCPFLSTTALCLGLILIKESGSSKTKGRPNSRIFDICWKLKNKKLGNMRRSISLCIWSKQFLKKH